MINFIVEDGTGIPSATSYVSVEEADDLAVMNIHNSNTWLALPLDAKQNLLIYVSRSLDARTLWTGTKVSVTQGLEWPRAGVVDRYNNALSSTAVPLQVRWAAVELAKWNIVSDKISSSVPENAVSEIKIDSITVKYADATKFSEKQFNVPDIVTDLLKGLGTIRAGQQKLYMARAVRA